MSPDPDGPPDDAERAGLYVLGAMTAEEMRAVRAEAGRNAVLASEISWWEQRLAPLAALAPAADVPEWLWGRIDARIAQLATGVTQPGVTQPGATQPGATQPQEAHDLPWQRASPRRAPPTWRALNLWRGAALGAAALAAGLGGLLVLKTMHTERLAVILPAGAKAGGWLAQLQPNGSILVYAAGTIGRPDDRDLELWALAEGATQPVPLGLMPRSAVRVLKPGNVPGNKLKLLVSMEPLGGSPTGLPTGPVVYSGDILTNAEAVR